MYQNGNAKKNMSNMSEHKAEMVDRLGMGFSGNRGMVSHSADIATIKQVR